MMMKTIFPIVITFLFYWETKGAATNVEHSQYNHVSKRESGSYPLGCPSCDCDCPTYTNYTGGQTYSSSYALNDCMSSCNTAFQGDCFCTKANHPTGCTLKDCTSEDLPEVGNYTCYCTTTIRPSDCVSRSNSNNPLCDPSTDDGTFDGKDCQCDTEAADPDNCNIRPCNANEITNEGYRCLCGSTCDRYPDGCVKETK